MNQCKSLVSDHVKEENIVKVKKTYDFELLVQPRQRPSSRRKQIPVY